MTVALKHDNNLQPRFREGWDARILGPEHWTESEPFFTNPRGILIHRVRSVRSYKNTVGVVTHYSTTCHCGNQFHFDDVACLVAVPPDGRLLCERCESIAVKNKLPTSEQLAGKHIHIGRLVAKQVCCTEQRESN